MHLTRFCWVIFTVKHYRNWRSYNFYYFLSKEEKRQYNLAFIIKKNLNGLDFFFKIMEENSIRKRGGGGQVSAKLYLLLQKLLKDRIVLNYLLFILSRSYCIAFLMPRNL